MCRCFRFFYGVLGNLARRFFAKLSRVPYEMCWCLKTESVPDIFQQTERSIVTEEFYKEIGREAAEKLLRNKQAGTFVIRPSKTSPFGTLSVVQDGKCFHLNTRVKQEGSVALGREKLNEKCFPNLDGLINYYISNYLVLNSANGGKTLTLLLPYRDETI